MNSCKIASIILSAAFGLQITSVNAAENAPVPSANDSPSTDHAPETETVSPIPIADAAPAVVTVETDEKRLTVALLMPPDNSPFVGAAKIIANGLAAANKTSRQPADLLVLEAASEVPIERVLEKAVLSGADVVVGPLQRSRVAEVAALKSLPIPVVSLNATTSDVAPDNLLMMSLATEYEAQQTAEWAIASLPRPTEGEAILPKTDTAEAPNPPVTVTAPPPRLLILKQNDEWDNRIAAAYEHTLTQAGVPFETYDIGDQPDINALKAHTQPTLPNDRLAYYRKAMQKAKALPGTTEVERKARKRAVTRVENDMAVERSLSEPPYPVALLALSAQTASMIRSSLPSKMRLWATSSTNPGDPATSSTSTTLAYDLSGLVFTETPLLVRYSAQSFEARFETAMPYSLAAKRLFAYGVDAFEVARAWAQKQPHLSFVGETGAIDYDLDRSHLVRRTPVTILITEGHLVEVDTKRVARPGPLPRVEVPVQQTLSVKEVLRPLPISTVTSITIQRAEDDDAAPTPPVAPLMWPGVEPIPQTTDTPLQRGVVR